MRRTLRSGLRKVKDSFESELLHEVEALVKDIDLPLSYGCSAALGAATALEATVRKRETKWAPVLRHVRFASRFYTASSIVFANSDAAARPYKDRPEKFGQALLEFAARL